MRRSPLQSAVQSYSGRALNVSAERLLNCYAEPNPQSAASPVAVYSSPGMESWADLRTTANGPVRGLHFFLGQIWAAIGSELYRIDSNATAVKVGDIPDGGPVYFADNGTHVWVCTRTDCYYANNTAFGLLPERSLYPAYQDGYLIGFQQSTDNIFLSGLDDATTIGGLDFTTSDAFPDSVVSGISVGRNVIAAGRRSIEIYYNSGNNLYPFDRIPGGVVERGILAAGTIAKDDVSAFFVGDDFNAYRIAGGQIQKISTPHISRLVEDEANPDGLRGYISRFRGHVFYIVVGDTFTISYDTSTQLWSEMGSPDILFNGPQLSRWRASGLVAAWGGVEYVGDFERSMVHKLSATEHSELGSPIRREMITPPIGDGNWAVLDSVEMDMETGNYDDTSDGLGDPEVMLSWSDDGGHTWSNELTATAGDVGEHLTQVRFSRLGRFRRRHIKVAVSAPFLLSVVGVRASIRALQ